MIYLWVETYLSQNANQVLLESHKKLYNFIVILIKEISISLLNVKRWRFNEFRSSQVIFVYRELSSRKVYSHASHVAYIPLSHYWYRNKIESKVEYQGLRTNKSLQVQTWLLVQEIVPKRCNLSKPTTKNRS